MLTIQPLHMNFDKSIVEFVGFNGPYIISAITAVRLFGRLQYLVAFIISRFTDQQINNLLKNIIKQERPSDGKSYGKEKYLGAQKYGMPSGHAESCFFALSFLYFTTNSTPLLILTGSIAVLTLYQRWSSRKHTVEQLLAGSLVGTFTGFLSYKLTKRFIETKKTPIF